MATMNDKYQDGSDHEVCDDCGFCSQCKDCEEYGCGVEQRQDDCVCVTHDPHCEAVMGRGPCDCGAEPPLVNS